MKKLLSPLIISALMGLSPSAQAFPPAPAHEIYGTVRSEEGRPLDSNEGIIILSGSATEITRAPSDEIIGQGVNYRLNVPMDANILTGLYQVSAMRPALPFTIKVLIRNVAYVPIQMVASTWNIGQPGGRTRIDLSLGVDSDGDGLPDSWEQSLIDSDPSGLLSDLSDVRPGDDLDKDGLTNLQEYLLGTYALERTDGLVLEILGLKDGQAHLRFAVVSGRTYTIKSSTDLTTWRTVDYAMQPGGATVPFSRARDTTIVNAYVPVGGATSMSFRLYAE